MKQIEHSSTPTHTGGMTAEFYNTSHLKGEELRRATKRVTTQSDKILDFLKNNPEEKFTSCEIRKHLIEQNKISATTQETTIRARLSDLSRKEFVIKLEEMRNGFYGMPNHLWTVRTEQ